MYISFYINDKKVKAEIEDNWNVNLSSDAIRIYTKYKFDEETDEKLSNFLSSLNGIDYEIKRYLGNIMNDNAYIYIEIPNISKGCILQTLDLKLIYSKLDVLDKEKMIKFACLNYGKICKVNMYIRGNKELVTKSCKIDASLIQKIEDNKIYKIDI